MSLALLILPLYCDLTRSLYTLLRVVSISYKILSFCVYVCAATLEPEILYVCSARYQIPGHRPVNASLIWQALCGNSH